MDEFEKLNSELGLWEFHPETGRALPHWLPNGALIRSAIEEFWKQEHLKQGYDLVYTPHIGTKDLWIRSGHMDRYADKMFPPLTDDEQSEEYILRPMNCPFHILLYKAEPRSYKQLPIRFAELGTVYRKIPSGSFKKAFNVRGFTQDDAHIFCEPHRVQKEIAKLIEFTMFFLKNVFKLNDSEYRIIRRTKPPGALGKGHDWDTAHKVLSDVLKEREIKFDNETGKGVFYGPKIDFEITDPISKTPWVCSTIQLDIILAESFDLVYRDNTDHTQVPTIIHRTILGSLERFLSILLARTEGHFPLWIAPCQVLIIPVGAKESEPFQSNLTYANVVKTTLEKRLSDLKPRIRVYSENADLRESKDEAIRKKIPHIVVVGAKESVNETVAVTSWSDSKYSSEPKHMNIEEFANELRTTILNKL